MLLTTERDVLVLTGTTTEGSNTREVPGRCREEMHRVKFKRLYSNSVTNCKYKIII